jgi:hypothetical protein
VFLHLLWFLQVQIVHLRLNLLLRALEYVLLFRLRLLNKRANIGSTATRIKLGFIILSLNILKIDLIHVVLLS